jgi:hypothetical protein
MSEGSTAVAGADGQSRCPWGLSPPDMLAYHDEEWGKPVTDDIGIFERLSLEGFQSGLSWLTILRKRENFRAAFGNFDPAVISDFGPADVERLLTDKGIVRNRAKIEAVISNARGARPASWPSGRGVGLRRRSGIGTADDGRHTVVDAGLQGAVGAVAQAWFPLHRSGDRICRDAGVRDRR